MVLECPNCREPVAFFRALRTTAWGRFPCRGCGSVLGISLGRRMLAVAIWLCLLLALILTVRVHTWGTPAFLGVMLITMLPVFYGCERITLVDRRAFTCRRCGYDLHGLPEPRCPECGCPFDPSERERILARIGSPPPSSPYRREALLVLVLLGLFVLVGLILTYRSAPAPRPTPAPLPESVPAPGGA